MKLSVEMVLVLEGDDDGLSDEAFDTWAWSLERTVEEMALVKQASVVDLTVHREVTS